MARSAKARSAKVVPPKPAVTTEEKQKSDNTPAKRGRGRPPKDPNAPKKRKSKGKESYSRSSTKF